MDFYRFTTLLNCKHNEKYDSSHVTLNTLLNYRHKNDRGGIWTKGVLGGFFQKLIKSKGKGGTSSQLKSMYVDIYIYV